MARLTRDSANEFDPTWSPDGRRIAFRVEQGDSPPDISVMNADGTGRTRLAKGLSPAWSPDGTKIAYADEHGTISIMRPDGSGQRPIPGTTGGEYPSWSPDSKQLAFSNVFPRVKDIYTVDLDGSRLKRLTTAPSGDWQVAWSPDGRKIAFNSDRDSTMGDIYLMNPDGSDVVRLTHNGGFSPAWSPNGRYIVFGAGDGLSIIRPDGTGLMHLPVAAAGQIGSPSWVAGH